MGAGGKSLGATLPLGPLVTPHWGLRRPKDPYTEHMEEWETGRQGKFIRPKIQGNALGANTQTR